MQCSPTLNLSPFCQKQYSLTSGMCTVSLRHPGFPWQLPCFLLATAPAQKASVFLWPQWAELRGSLPPLLREITVGSMQNQSATALKGQYVANKHTQAERMQTKRVRALQSYTCITHSVRVLSCEDSTGLIDES